MISTKKKFAILFAAMFFPFANVGEVSAAAEDSELAIIAAEQETFFEEPEKTGTDRQVEIFGPSQPPLRVIPSKKNSSEPTSTNKREAKIEKKLDKQDRKDEKKSQKQERKQQKVNEKKERKQRKLEEKKERKQRELAEDREREQRKLDEKRERKQRKLDEKAEKKNREQKIQQPTNSRPIEEIRPIEPDVQIQPVESPNEIKSAENLPQMNQVGLPNPLVTCPNFDSLVATVKFTPLYMPKKSGYIVNNLTAIDGRIAEIEYGRRWEPDVSLRVRTYKRGQNENLSDISGVQGVKWRIDVSSGTTIYIAKIDENSQVAAWAVGQYTFSAQAKSLSFAGFHALVAEELVDLSTHYYI